MTGGPQEVLPAAHEMRVVVLPPTRADGEAIGKLLSAAYLTCSVARNMTELCQLARSGAGSLMLSEEALLSDPQPLFDCIAHQPLWSDLPVIVLSRTGREASVFADMLSHLGNVSVIERPVRTSTLLSQIQSSQRARTRQYQLRENLIEREQLLKSEQAARGEAERASRMKDEFLATLSHELRTPLNAVLGWTQVLKKTPGLATEVGRVLGIIERNARSQAQIIEDLLDMSSIISGKVRLHVDRVDLGTVIEATVEAVRPTAQTKGVRLQMVLDPLAGPVRGDPNRLQQVLWNLLTNAVKFTPQDGHVTVTLARVDHHLEVEVADSGEGIDPTFLPYVFDRFRQADSSSARRHGGLGLGLSIVKQLVELHGGTIKAQSAGAGSGATFRVVLPLMAANDPRVAGSNGQDHAQDAHESAPVDPLEPISLQGIKVLVVDDEPDSRSLLKRVLEECDAQVIVAASAEEALEHVSTQALQVLVSDIGMPKQNGYDLIQRVRSLDGGRAQLPAIALTAYARSEDRLKAIRAGFQLHLSKPVEPDELVSMIQSLVRGTAGH